MKTLFYLFLCMSCVCIGTSCSKSAHSIVHPLRIHAAYWTGFMPMVLADELGYFKNEKVNVEYHFTNNSSNLLMEFEAGAYDGAFLPLSSFLTSRQVGDFKVVMATDHATSANAVLAFPKIKKIKDLKGKKVATVPGAYGESFVTSMLTQNEMKSADILWVQIENENDAVKQFLEKKVDAIHLWEPYLSKLVKNGARPLFEAQSVPGVVVDTLAVRNKVIKERRQELKSFFKAWFAAVDFWKKNPREAELLVARKLNLSVEEVRIQGFYPYDLRDNLKTMQLGSDYSSLYYVGEMVINFLFEKNYIYHKNDIAEIIDPSLIEELR